MRFFISLYLTKVLSLVIKFFKLGSGYTWPGHAALKVYPTLLSNLKIRFPRGVVLISGTNGKTTTSKIITHLCESQGLKVINNSTGANLINGITSSILLSTDLFGRLDTDIGVFEVDEFALPDLLDVFTPDHLVLLNLSRDQLDRYGEVDIIFEKWESAVLKLKNKATLLTYKDQSQFKHLQNKYEGPSQVFNDNLAYLKHTALKGDFNARNVNAAVLVASLFGIDEKGIVNSLEKFTSAYGRGEVIPHKGKDFHVFLAKNPASFNNNLDLFPEFDANSTGLLFILNDNIPDGRDVSWIYDIDSKKLSENAKDFRNIYISGTRSLDMAIRLKYSGLKVPRDNINNDLTFVIKEILINSGIEEVLVLPNYSAMLNIRKILTGKAIL